VLVLYLGIGAIFFAVGLLTAWSESAKGSVLIGYFLTFLGSGSAGMVLGGGKIPLLSMGDNSANKYASVVGSMLLAMALGTILGVIFGVSFRIWIGEKYPHAPKVSINMVRPHIRPEYKIPPPHS